MITRMTAITLAGLFLTTNVDAGQSTGTAAGEEQREAATAASKEPDGKAVALEGSDLESAAAIRRPMQEVKTLGTADDTDNERFNVRQDFGQVQQKRERNTASVADPDYESQPTTRENGDNGKSDKSEAARSLGPCPAAPPPPASAPPNAAAVAAGCLN